MMTKKRRKLWIGMLILILTMVLIGACGKKKDEDATSKGNVTTESGTQQSENTDEEQGAKEVQIYSINDNSLESEQTYVTMEEVTPETVVQAVVDSLAEHSLEVGIDSVTMEGDRVIVSFLYGKAPLTSVGSTVEETILNSIADSLLDNVDGCKKVVFRAEGEAYESGHYAFGINEVYASE